ncbi:MAG: hypothetical protein AAF127_06870 [Pseudomonadota bacterium]
MIDTRRFAFGLWITCIALLSGCGGEDSAPPPPDPINAPPSVSAGADRTAPENTQVTLQGSVTDPDSTPALNWAQVSGPSVALSDSNAAQASFTAPFVDGSTGFTFRLTADDGVNPPVSDEVTVTISDAGVRVSSVMPAGESFIDHEIHPTRPEMVFQSFGQVFVAAYDPQTGRLVSTSGKDRLVDDTLSLTQTLNGPEYGRDRNGVAIFYNKQGGDGSTQVWRATELADGSYRTEQISPDGTDRINQLASQNQASAETFLMYLRRSTPLPQGALPTISYFAEDQPSGEAVATLAIDGDVAGFRWVRGAALLTTTIGEGADQGQIRLVDPSTGVQRTITEDAGVKFDPFGWYAPEFGGDLAVLAIVNGTDIAIYRDTGGTFFERVAVLPPPAATNLRFLQSPEPFVSRAGRSLISLTVKDVDGPVATAVNDSQIWLYGIEDGADRFVLRCDDGGAGHVRHEAEVVSGNDQVFVYYNEILPDGRFDLVLCETGLAP